MQLAGCIQGGEAEDVSEPVLRNNWMLREARNAPFLKLHISWSGCRLSLCRQGRSELSSWGGGMREAGAGRLWGMHIRGLARRKCRQGIRVWEAGTSRIQGVVLCCLTVKNWREDVGRRVIKLFQWSRTLAEGVVERRSCGQVQIQKWSSSHAPQIDQKPEKGGIVINK